MKNTILMALIFAACSCDTDVVRCSAEIQKEGYELIYVVTPNDYILKSDSAYYHFQAQGGVCDIEPEKFVLIDLKID